MRIRVPAPTLLSRVTPDVDLDMTGYKVVNAGNVDLQTDGVIVNDLLLKRLDINRFGVLDNGDTTYKNLWVKDFIAYGNMIINTDGRSLRAKNADDAYARIKARENTVGLAEVARLTGAATPTFDLLAGRLTGDLNGNGYYPVNKKIKVGDNLLDSADTTASGTDTVYTKKKEMVISVSGTYRIKFTLNGEFSGTFVYGRIYKNGNAHGTERSSDTANPVTYTEDLDFAAGDLLQLYGKTADSSVEYYLSNFRAYAAEAEVIKVTMD